MDASTKLRILHKNQKPHTHGRLGLIDMGSNAMRLVIYADVKEYPYIYHYERVRTKLAEGKGEGSFSLSEEKQQETLKALKWFMWVAQEANVRALVGIATSAVREAENGDAFIERIEKELGINIDIISGQTEAKLAAIGACASLNNPEGVVLDLGGGSLELYDVDEEHFISLPLGVLSLDARCKDAQYPGEEAYKLIKQTLEEQAPWLKNKKQVIANGGGMRALAAIHMMLKDYPLDILQDYRIHPENSEDFFDQIIQNKLPNMQDLKAYDDSFEDVLKYRAATLKALADVTAAESIRFTTYGIREGVLFSQMGEEQRVDPFISYAKEISKRDGRGLDYSDSLYAFARRVLPDLNRTYIKAATAFVESTWREQELNRAPLIFDKVIGGSYVGCCHKLRSKIAATCYYRHQDKIPEVKFKMLEKLLNEEDFNQAKALGVLCRLASLLDPGAKGVLHHFKLEWHENELSLIAPQNMDVAHIEPVSDCLTYLENLLK